MGSRMSSKRMANSSPPSLASVSSLERLSGKPVLRGRETVSARRTASVNRWPILTSSSSPAECPRLSLMILNSSTSMSNTANL